MRVLIEITSFLIFLPVLIGILNYKSLTNKFRLLTSYCLLFGFLEITFTILSFFNLKTIFLVHIFVPIEIVMLGGIFHIHFRDWLPAWLIPLVISSFVILSITNSVFLQAITIFPSYALYLQSLIIIILSLTYFYQVFTELKVEKLWEESMFWFSTGLLIYHAGTMILYLSSNYLLKVSPQSFVFLYSLVQSVCHFLMYSLFTVAIWKGQKK